eukprot:GFUD01076523.1.p1 GENE.GFUD01076523.1~~GFUD01076523.1.p1  ORF type:complete len:288 (-),score=83.51 GFUD01076523.1:30-893(-)
MKTPGQHGMSNSTKLWCYNCKIWIRDKYSSNHFNGRAHKEGRVRSRNKIRRGKRKSCKVKIQEKIFTKNFLDNQELSGKVEEESKVETLNDNVENVDGSVNESNDDTTTFIDGIQTVTLDSPGLSQSFRESHAVAELEPSFQPNWDVGGDRTVRYRQADKPPNSDESVETQVCNKDEPVLAEQNIGNLDPEVPPDKGPTQPGDRVSDQAVEYQVSDASKYQNWANLISIDQDQMAKTQPPDQAFDLRSKLTKGAGVLVNVPDSFHKDLDIFLKEARRDADSAFKSQF